MKIYAIVCVTICFMVCEGRLDKDTLRKSLNVSPLFSHQRESPIPELQNVAIHLPANDPDIAVPAKAQRIVKEGNGRPQMPQDTPIAAGKPTSGARIEIGRVSSAQADSKPVTKPKPANGNNKCSFQIPSFLLPDPNPNQAGSKLKCPSFLLPGPAINPELVNVMVEHWTGLPSGSGKRQLNKVRSKITQIEFEQKCLVPALRAHVLGGEACRSRALTVYLEWLLYLRKQLFNV